MKVATVEYQPNLEHPVKPVPFGVIVEGLGSDERTVVILGREPLPPVYAQLQLTDAWGPFLKTATEWVEVLGKGIRELFETTQPKRFVVDELAAKWHWNLFVTEPAVVESRLTEDALARERYREVVGVAFGNAIPEPQPRPSVRPQRTSPPPPWLSSAKGLQVGAGVAVGS